MLISSFSSSAEARPIKILLSKRFSSIPGEFSLLSSPDIGLSDFLIFLS
jgi:hypothetical protein